MENNSEPAGVVAGGVGKEEKMKLSKSVSLLGFFGLGLSAIFGASWLLTSGIWLDAAGGPYNALIAFALCFIVELPLVLAYYEAVPMIPLAGGELSYSYLSFGNFVGMIVGWFGVLVNIILCAWEALAISRLLSILFPAIDNTAPLYTLLGYPVTVPAIIIGLSLILLVFFVQYRGAKLSALFGTIITITVCSLALIGVIVGIFNFHPENLQIAQTKGTLTGSLSLLAMLPFSIAGWETVAKGAQEASKGVAYKKIGSMIILALAIACCMYVLTMLIPAGLVPWSELAGDAVTAPFQYALVKIGVPVLGTLLVVAAFFGVIGVYNAVFFGATRMLYSMGEYGMVPRMFAKLHPRYKSPVNAVIFVSLISCSILFLGKGMFIPLIDVAAVAYIILWGSTLASVFWLRRKYPDLKRPARYPGGIALMIVGLIIAVVLLLLMLVPGSPAALIWPVEYITLGVLILIGIVLYFLRDKSLSQAEQDKRILGEIKEELEQ
jgi:amino acid transporter